MEVNREQILEIVLSVLHELGEDLDNEELQNADENTRLFGARSPLDSMNLVNFIAETEERLADDLDINVILANQSAMSMAHSPFRKVASCTDYIVSLAAEDQS